MKKTTANHWLKEAVIYALDVRSFRDGNRDGLGDLKGLTAKFDYLVELGITCLWILPFFSSDNQDGGYDIVDYYEIDPRLGTWNDFEKLIKKAKKSGVRIIIDLVVNHTSKHHPWFQQAIRSPSSSLHHYYIWENRKPKNDAEDVVFQTVENSNWAYEPAIKKYYYHTFYTHQPDLNVANPLVQQEIVQIIKFWAEKGVSGFRIDAAPHILRKKGKERFQGDPYNIINQWRNELFKINKEGVLIGEADVEPEKYPEFFNKGRRLTAIFNFFFNNYLFLAFAEQHPQALIKAFVRLPLFSKHHLYLNFLRNHDELDLERLQQGEREKVYQMFAPKSTMKIYGRGIRRRLATMVDNDERRMKLAMHVLFSLPGIPVIRYGEEIGMGDDLRLSERESVRTTMQWSTSANGGFSPVAEHALRYPIIREGIYSFRHVNVAKQRHNKSSLWHCVAQLIAARKRHNLFVYGAFRLLTAQPKQIMAYTYEGKKETVVVIHNFSADAQEVMVNLKGMIEGNWQCLIGKPLAITKKKRKLNVGLAAYSSVWLHFRS